MRASLSHLFDNARFLRIASVTPVLVLLVHLRQGEHVDVGGEYGLWGAVGGDGADFVCDVPELPGDAGDAD